MIEAKANKGKNIEITVQGRRFSRFPIRTTVFQKGDDYADKIMRHVTRAVKSLRIPATNRRWYVVVSEKVIAISQGRSYFIKDIHPSWYAITLSKYVTKTPYGIGLGSPWTMELAIREVGLFRILIAATVSVVTKPFGLKGIFYHIAGREARSIDGPTSYSLYPSNVSAKLAPKDPQKVAEKIDKMINDQLSNAGVVIIDANDLGRNILGNTTDKPDSFFEEVMRDNPMGQGREQTPVVIILENI